MALSKKENGVSFFSGTKASSEENFFRATSARPMSTRTTRAAMNMCETRLGTCPSSQVG